MRNLRNRRRRSARLSLLTAGLALLLVPLLAGTALATGQVGEPAADFTLQATDGTWYTLSDFGGQIVFLYMIGYN